MTALLLAGAGSGLGPGDWSSSESESSSEEEDEEDSVDVTSTMVSGISNDGKVLAHNHIWEFCSDLLVDPATLQRERKTFFSLAIDASVRRKKRRQIFLLDVPVVDYTNYSTAHECQVGGAEAVPNC
ncbi:unnamed protein product [Phytophthora fragariaefolia]|uniref:Unnamed protein product n=1 Tax=Phytophthora fragariaefolia TaxID=1490495 RepID=A0A9W7D5I9_9STRA|nr:unnamed protein product [Phytophthora fragariaefolia]